MTHIILCCNIKLLYQLLMEFLLYNLYILSWLQLSSFLSVRCYNEIVSCFLFKQLWRLTVCLFPKLSLHMGVRLIDAKSGCVNFLFLNC